MPSFCVYARMCTVICVAYDKAGAAWVAGALHGLLETKADIARCVGVGLGGLPLLALCQGDESPLDIMPWVMANQAKAALLQRLRRPWAWCAWHNFGEESEELLEEAFPGWNTEPTPTGHGMREFVWAGWNEATARVTCVTTSADAGSDEHTRLQLALGLAVEPRMARPCHGLTPLSDGRWEQTALHTGPCILLYAGWGPCLYEGAGKTYRLATPPTGAETVQKLLRDARVYADWPGLDVPRDLACALANLGHLATYCDRKKASPPALCVPGGDVYGLWGAVALLADMPAVPFQRRRPARGTVQRSTSASVSLSREVPPPLDHRGRPAPHLPRQRDRPAHRAEAIELAVPLDSSLSGSGGVEDAETLAFRGLVDLPVPAYCPEDTADEHDPPVKRRQPSQTDEGADGQSESD